MQELLPVILVIPLPLALIWAMVSDIMRLEIPNSIPIILIVAYLFAAVVMELEYLTILQQLAIGAGALIVGLGLFAAGILGGGDVKLLAGCVPWLGLDQLPVFFLLMALAGGLLALATLLLRRFSFNAAWRRSRWFDQLSKGQQKIPYGLAIGCAGLVVTPNIPILGN